MHVVHLRVKLRVFLVVKIQTVVFRVDKVYAGGSEEHNICPTHWYNHRSKYQTPTEHEIENGKTIITLLRSPQANIRPSLP